MQIQHLHSWEVGLEEARRLQESLRTRLIFAPLQDFETVAATDVSFSLDDDRLFAAVVVMRLPDFRLIEVAHAERRSTFPYIPGYLSFREAPALLEAFEKLRTTPEVVLCDGQGIAHPRRLGIAGHLGLFLQIPTLGCAKSVLVGKFAALGNARGATAPMIFENEQVGVALRSRPNVKPVFVSPGHLIDLESSVKVVLRCLSKYRVPEPLRQAHILVNELRRKRANR
ncbi:MAG: deoxyribonuclease V [candidate division KSB1 bacterium]|nr:deoxyribonuclease V [candidate division KSB1 bacterium]MDZ7301856.1 deoxyribonuclease V [candidate division KSB1 bacterium]MDZ7310239.1 deoxyribonuclease V [candidate division KSB1 bacterium]